MAGEFPYVLLVEGEWDPNTPKLKNKLTIYFQSKKSNGGDCSVQLLGGQRATVSFKTEEVRQQVLKRKSHRIKIGQKDVSLNVHLSPEEDSAVKEAQSSIKAHHPDNRSQAESPSKDEEPSTAEPESEEPEEQGETEEGGGRKSAVLENIQEMNQEFLIMLVENVIKDVPEPKDFSIEVIPESNCAVVTFVSKKGAGNFIMSCPDNSVFRKKNLDVRFLEVTTKVKVEDLPSNLNSDYITLYFEKYGETDGEVVMLEDGQSAIIPFQDQTAVNTVLRTQHQIKKQPIKVFPYYDSLGTALYGKDRPILRLPETFTENIDESIGKYFQDNQGKLDLIRQEMCKHFCQLDLRDSSVKISPLASLLRQGLQTRKLIQTWREKASAEFATAMSKYKSLEINILRDAWSETVAEIHKALSAEPVTLVLHKDQATAILAGLAEDVCRAEDVMHSTIDRITERVQREKGSITDEINMASSIYEIVMLGGLELEIQNSFPKMELSYHSHSQKLVLYGLKQEVLESKNKILQGVIGLNRRVVELHPSVLEFLTKREQERLTSDLFLSKGISASLEIKDNQAWLITKTERVLKDSEEHLKAVLDFKCLDIEDISVIRRPEWQDLITSLNNLFNSSVKVVLINTSGNQVIVSGFAEKVKLVLEQLTDFLKANSNITLTLKADKIVVRFIQENKKQEWFESVKNKVNIDFKDDGVLLSGPRVHVSQCKPVFEDLLSSVYQDNLKVAKPGAKKFFKSKESMYVAAAKINTGCLVELVDENEVLQAGGVSIGKKGVLTPEGVEIVVSKGDMCSYAVDAVVNAANEKLDFSGGLSKAISDAAGPQLQDACHQIIKARKQLNAGDAVLTKAGGQLCCKYVIHAVGPHFDRSDSQKSVGLLKKAVKRSLNLADRENCQSVAIPAISSGNLDFPLDLCANSIVEALKEFFEFVSEDLCVKKIHLVDNNDRTVEALKTAVQKVYGGSSTSQGITSKGHSSQNQQNTKTQKHIPSVSNQGSSQSVKTKEGLTVTLSKRNIQDTSMDVVVNSISSDLSLNHGAISSAILSTAGPQLQTLLNQQVTGNVNVGDVFVTTGGNLKNKLVFHAVAPHWKQGQGQEQKVLEGIMDKCLGQAEQQQQKSIVFPAIGTGNLGFPKALVASLMLDSVLKFSKKRASSHVQEVMFALSPQDIPTIQAFTNEFNNKFNIQTSSTQQQSKGPFSKITSKSGIHETTVGGIVLQVLSGDITKQNTDVIVNSSNENFTLKAGVSKAVLDAAGPNVEVECAVLGAQQNQGLIMTQPGTLQCKKIIHVSAKSDPATIYQRVKQVLKMTAQQKLTSISFPALGTGQGGANPGQVADSMLDAVLDFGTKTPNSSIKMVRMVIFQAPMLTDFQQSMQKREGGSDKQKKEGVLSKAASFAKSLFSGSKNKDDQQKKGKDFVIEGKAVNAACFSICGPSQASVDQAKQWIEKLILDEQAFELISDPMVLNLSDKDQQRIQELQQSMDVNVRLEHKAQGGGSEEATILVEGLSRDVLVAVSEIQTMLRKTRDEFSLRKEIELASGIVDWQYQQGGQYQSFDQLTNFHLEKALTQKSPHVDITFQGQAYKVTMPEGPAVSAVGGNQMSIRRIDKLQVPVIDSLPQEWETMTPTELCRVCPLQPGDKEYKDVLSHFRKTCPNNNVLQIARIQNPGMWKKYQNNKHIMEIKNGHQNNEKMLFHGTREDSMKHINHSGFNRSYAGVNATAYGKGTYFALNASYSSSNTYSVPDHQGHKHMYFCRVLTGDYTTGHSSMFVPPPKSANGIDLYDSVVDRPTAPTIFVVFRDDHAYPEYLITFA
ncbi:poly(ADP-ribose) polymerase family member 14-related sequence 1 isoform X2 [Salminus brasiliensis]|uniref:poly(ADP-ribose) polymerase family member 14-related sequence 1 isoform X2 n=1 Tax=Salminus brasiliensis TaxID=930266 RepID=UPI003B83859D